MRQKSSGTPHKARPIVLTPLPIPVKVKGRLQLGATSLAVSSRALRTTKYWSCVARTTQSLEQHRQGIHDIDLVDITEKLETVVPMPDSGFAARHEDGVSRSHAEPQTSSLLELERYLANPSANLPLAARPGRGESPVRSDVAIHGQRLMSVPLTLIKPMVR
jgi:hypothetical protein